MSISYDVSKVKLGEVYENYNKLCEAMQVKPSTNREKQLQSFSKWVDIIRVGKHGYKIAATHPVKKKTPPTFKRPVGRPKKIPVIKEQVTGLTEKSEQDDKDKRDDKAKLSYDLTVRRNGRYILECKNIIMHELSIHDGTYAGNYSDMAALLGVLPNDFNSVIQFKTVNGRLTDEVFFIDGFKYNVSLCASSIISQSLLKGVGERKGLFATSEVIYYVDVETNKAIYENWMANKPERLSPKEFNQQFSREFKETDYKMATEEQMDTYNKIVSEVLKKYSIPNYSKLFYEYHRSDHRSDDGGERSRLSALKELKDRLQDELGWHTHVRKIKLTINPDIPDDVMESYKNRNVNVDRMNLNRKFMDRLDHVFKDRSEEIYECGSKHIGELAFGNPNDVKTISRKCAKEYHEVMMGLANKYVAIKPKDEKVKGNDAKPKLIE